MTYLIAAGFGALVMGTVALLALLIPAPRAVRERLGVVAGESRSALATRMREKRRQQLEALVQELGTEFQQRYPRASKVRKSLLHAGYHNPNAPAIYWGVRIVASLVLSSGSMLLLSSLGVPAAWVFPVASYFGSVGWVTPALFVWLKRRKRQKALIKALPDALDMMVVCVEAGLGLNQAVARVGNEMMFISEEMSQELGLINLEIRAGTPRAEALDNFALRTGLDDIKSLVTMLIQTDRFGTSIARSLRVHSDTLREKRKQRAEEAAAKTTIKLVFPLVLCIFPTMGVMILGGGIIRIVETLGQIL